MFEEDLFEILACLILMILTYIALQWFCTCNTNEKQPCIYSYGDNDGPHTWKYRFHTGENQSPINILWVCAIVVPSETVPPLDFTPEVDT